jgi:hypothetical protein
MALSIELTPDDERQLKAEAARKGVAVEEYARALIVQALPHDVERQKKLNQPTIELLERWAKESETTDPAEIAKAEAELAEFKRAMNETREAAGARKIYP